MRQGDYKHFRNFKKTHTMVTDQCDCGEKFTQVHLQQSSKDVLTVRCSDEKCTGFILARRKGLK